jgi:hypothetical protein
LSICAAVVIFLYILCIVFWPKSLHFWRLSKNSKL